MTSHTWDYRTLPRFIFGLSKAKNVQLLASCYVIANSWMRKPILSFWFDGHRRIMRSSRPWCWGILIERPRTEPLTKSSDDEPRWWLASLTVARHRVTCGKLMSDHGGRRRRRRWLAAPWLNRSSDLTCDFKKDKIEKLRAWLDANWSLNKVQFTIHNPRQKIHNKQKTKIKQDQIPRNCKNKLRSSP